MFPDGMITRELEVGPATDLVSGAPVDIRVMIRPSRSLVWDGAPVVPSLKTYTVPAGATAQIELPTTDQAGYYDQKGNLIVLEDGEHAFFYKINVYYLINGSVSSQKPQIKAVLPEGVGPVDIDTLVQFDSQNAGAAVAIPDIWSANVAAAEAAAAAAAASAATAENAVVELENSIGTAVEDWFADNSDSVVSPESLEAALQAHREEPTPHEAYDVDMPSLKLIFENGLV